MPNNTRRVATKKLNTKEAGKRKRQLVGRKQERSILLALQEEIDTHKSFKQICDENTKKFGKKSSEQRRNCQQRRRQIVQKAIKHHGDFVELLKKHKLAYKMKGTRGFSALSASDATEIEDDFSGECKTN